MQIKRLRLTGFKSFVDPADLRIEPGLTGIVGPNGCGKSNLLEALRWAMGENSAKSMRGAGMEDVIFAGTATRPQRDFAEVSILADEVGEEDELEVVRRIERGAGSAYRINGRDVRARDVALIFADSATGAHSPALVSQGRIGSIISAKPAERRAMLEEAAGIAGLHVRRKDAEQRLRATEANLTRLDEVIADQETRASALRRQARQAERYRELSDKIRGAEARMIFARWRDAAAAADLAKKEAATAEALVTTRAEAQQVAALLQQAAAEALAGVRADALAVRDRATEAMHRLATLRSERTTVARRIGELKDAELRLAEDRGREGALARDAADALARLAEEAAALEGRIAAATERLPELDAALAEAERAARNAEVALAQALAAQASEAAEARVAEAALAAARTRVERSARDSGRLEAEVKALADPTPLQAEKARAAEARAQALRQAETARTGLARADSAERGAIESRDRAQSARATAHAELSQLDSEAAALAKATRPAGKDRLLDKLGVDAGYERALAAALGDDLEAGLDATAERYWAGAEAQSGDPRAPQGTTALGAHVQAPAALARRLAQVLVAESDTGQPLAVGQRLVTLGGHVAPLGRLCRHLGRCRGGRAIGASQPAPRDREGASGRGARRRCRRCRAGASRRDDRRSAPRRRRLPPPARSFRERRARRRARRGPRRRPARADRVAARSISTHAARASPPSRTKPRASSRAPKPPRPRSPTAARPAIESPHFPPRPTRAVPPRPPPAPRAAPRSRKSPRRASASPPLRPRAAAGNPARAKRRGAAPRWTSAPPTLPRKANALPSAPPSSTGRWPKPRRRAKRRARPPPKPRPPRRTPKPRSAPSRPRSAPPTNRSARPARSAPARWRAPRTRTCAEFEMNRLSGERFECPPPLLPERVGFREDGVRGPQEESASHDRLIAERERIGPVNLIAESELAELVDSAEANTRERDELTQAVHRLRGSIGTLNREGRQRLLAAFEAVDQHFRRLFTTLFNGGQAHLELVDSDDPLEAGLEIMAQPPGKKLQSLTLLSGGEQALTAIALIFALFLTNPAPICVLDEVDAPLDDANIERFCDLLEAMTRETATRYLIVTHNAATMSRMHRLFGVTMVEKGVSRLVSVDLGGAETLLAAE